MFSEPFAAAAAAPVASLGSVTAAAGATLDTPLVAVATSALGDVSTLASPASNASFAASLLISVFSRSFAVKK